MSIAIIRLARSMKAANITSVFRKDNQTDKANYRPIRILLNAWKNLEWPTVFSTAFLFDKMLYIQQCEFRKGFNYYTREYCVETNEDKCHVLWSFNEYVLVNRGTETLITI